MGTTALPSREPKEGRKGYVTLACRGSLAKKTESKGLNWGQGQNFACAVQKNTTKKCSQKWCERVENTGDFKKGGGVFQTLPHCQISENPSPPPLQQGGNHLVATKVQVDEPLHLDTLSPLLETYVSDTEQPIEDLPTHYSTHIVA